jgi:hypothetical protein
MLDRHMDRPAHHDLLVRSEEVRQAEAEAPGSKGGGDRDRYDGQSLTAAGHRHDSPWPGGWTAAPALIGYLALAVLLFANTWVHPGGAWVGNIGDPHLFIWYLGWVPHQLGQLHNPLYTDHILYPGGANLMWNTAILAPAVLAWPITGAFGPVVAYNVLITLALALSAWFAYLAARRFLPGHALPAGVGLLYGFSPYMAAQARGHLHMVIAVFPPLALILLHEILVRQRRSPVLLGTLLGGAAAVQLLTGEEVLAMTALAAAAGVGLLALLHPDEVAARAPRALAALGVAVLLFTVFASYPLAFQLFGPRRVGGLLQQPNVYVNDLLGFVVPPSPMALSWSGSVAVTSHFTGNVAENDAYVGLPLLLLFGAAAALFWRRPFVRWATLLTVGLAVLSMGPHLHVGGFDTGLHLPWSAFSHLPLLDSAVPSRLMMLAFLGAGLVVAELVLAGAATGGWRRAVTAVATALALVPLLPHWPYASTTMDVPAFFEPGGGVDNVPAGSVALVTPISTNLSSTAMLWQSVAGYRFKMPSGEAFVPGPSLGPPESHLKDTLTTLDRGGAAPATPSDMAQTRRDLAALGVATVIAGPSPGQDRLVAYLTEVVGRPPEQSGGVDVWWDVERGG